MSSFTRSDRLPDAHRRRTAQRFLAAVAAWNVSVGIVLWLIPAGRGGVGDTAPIRSVRSSAAVEATAGLLFAVAAIRPGRAAIIAAAAAKAIGGLSGGIRLARSQRDVIAAAGLADIAWIPAACIILRRLRRI